MEDTEAETTENGPELDSVDETSVISRLNPTETIADSQSFEDFPDSNVKIIPVQKDGNESEVKKKTGSSSGCKAQVAIDESSLNRSENETKSGSFSGCKAQVEIENSSFKRSISNMCNCFTVAQELLFKVVKRVSKYSSAAKSEMMTTKFGRGKTTPSVKPKSGSTKATTTGNGSSIIFKFGRGKTTPSVKSTSDSSKATTARKESSIAFKCNFQEKWAPGTWVVAGFQFRGSSKDDLPFNKGDVITIIQSTRDPNWYKGRNENGREGLVPANYVSKRKEMQRKEVQRKVVQLRAMAWFHGKIKREKAEELLKPRKDGLFLVRESVNYPGDFTLSVCHHGKVEHYRIIYVDDRVTIDEETYFDNLAQLVQHYTLDADGLCTRLLQPLQKQGSDFATVALHDFESGGWVIDKRDLFIGEVTGNGEFGGLYEGGYKVQQVAIKQLKEKDNAAQAFLKEAAFMTYLRHHNLVQLIGVVLGDNMYLVTEFMGKGNLVEYLRSRGRSVITKKDQINFATDTCSAMQYLESKDFVHRDLAARNVLINDDNTAKVSNFHLAKYGDFTLEGGEIPIKWTSPEALSESKFTSKSDVWSFGILLWEIYSFGRGPYPGFYAANLLKHLEKGYRMRAPEDCPKKIYDIMLESWNIVADKRPTFKEVLNNLNHLRATTV